MGLFKKIINFSSRIIFSLENSKAPFIYFILTFFFAATLRNFLEIFSDNPRFNVPECFIHYYASYIALAMSLILLIRLLTKTEIIKIAKVALPSFIILSLAPIMDLILSGGRGYDITYLIPGVHNNLVLRFFTFFGDFPGHGVTPGMRIEVALGLIGGFIYFYSKKINFIRSLFSAILIYILLFCYFAIPFFIKGILEFLGLKFYFSNLLLINFYLVIMFLTGIPLAYFTSKKYFQMIIKDIRPFRLISFELMFFLGILMGTKYVIFDFNNINIFYFIFIPISIAFAWLFSVFVNNIEDYEIDKISNKERPLIKPTISLEGYKKLSWFFLGLALLYALAVNFQTLFIISLFIGSYFLYSARPLRLRRVPFFSKLFISLDALILIILGFMTITGSIDLFPKLIIVIFLIGATAIANFIDIKDYQGDKKAGIKTLPVILGLKRAKFVIGLFFILVYLSVYFLIREFYKLEKIPLILYLLVLGLVQFYLINKRNYNEKHIFLVFFFTLITFIILFFL